MYSDEVQIDLNLEIPGYYSRVHTIRANGYYLRQIVHLLGITGLGSGIVPPGEDHTAVYTGWLKNHILDNIHLLKPQQP